MRTQTAGAPRAATTRAYAWLRADLHWLLAPSLLASLVLKALVAFNPALGRLNSDQAVLYLQARQVSHGHVEAWFWGQEYGGSLFQTLLGSLFAIVGPRLWLLPVGVVATSTGVVVLTWRVGATLVNERTGAGAAALVALGPPTWIFFGVSSEPFYTLGLCASLGALLLALRPVPLDTQRALQIGVLLGISLWESPFSLVTGVPALAVLALQVRPRPALSAMALLGAAVGGFPVTAAALLRGTFLPQGFHNDSSLLDRTEAAGRTWAAVFLRFAPGFVPEGVLRGAAIAALALGAGSCCLFALRATRSASARRRACVLAPVLLWVPFHVHYYLPSDLASSRYGLALLPFLALFVADVLQRSWRVVAVAALTLAFTVAGLIQATDGFMLVRDPQHNPSYQALAANLREHRRTSVYADYWIAYRLAAETDEKIVADAPAQSRWAPYKDAAADAVQATIVVFADRRNDRTLRHFFDTQAKGLAQRVVVAQFAIYYLDQPISHPRLSPSSDVDR